MCIEMLIVFPCYPFNICRVFSNSVCCILDIGTLFLIFPFFFVLQFYQRFVNSTDFFENKSALCISYFLCLLLCILLLSVLIVTITFLWLALGLFCTPVF